MNTFFQTDQRQIGQQDDRKSPSFVFGRFFALPLGMIFARHSSYGDAITVIGSISIFAWCWSWFAYCNETGCFPEGWPKTKADLIRLAIGILSLCLPLGIFYVMGLFWNAKMYPGSWFIRSAISLLVGVY